MDNKALKAIHDVIATSYDAAEGFGKAAKGVHDRELSDWLAGAEGVRQNFADGLNDLLRHSGEEPRVDLHEGGILRKGWVDLEQRLRSTEPHLHSKDDTEIVRECVTGDASTLGHYDHALAQELPQAFREMLLDQRARVEDQQMYLQDRISRHRSQTA